MRRYCYYKLISPSLSCHFKPKMETYNPNFQFHFLLSNGRNPVKSHIPKLPTLYPKISNFSTTATSEKVSDIVNEISGLTLLEVSDLTEVLRKKTGIEEVPVMAIMMPGMGFSGGIGMKGKSGGAEGKVEEKAEKTVFDLNLEGGFDAGAKIKIIKEVRSFTSLGLKEAKDIVEKAPTFLKKGVTKEEAEKIVEKMKEVGAKVTMV